MFMLLQSRLMWLAVTCFVPFHKRHYCHFCPELRGILETSAEKKDELEQTDFFSFLECFSSRFPGAKLVGNISFTSATLTLKKKVK